MKRLLTEQQKDILNKDIIFEGDIYYVRLYSDEKVVIHHRDAVKTDRFYSNIFVYNSKEKWENALKNFNNNGNEASMFLYYS